MKKILISVMCIMLLCLLAACGKVNDNDSLNDQNSGSNANNSQTDDPYVDDENDNNQQNGFINGGVIIDPSASDTLIDGTPSAYHNIVGNTQPNLANLGHIAYQGSTVYYSDPADNDKLYRLNEDGTTQRLTDINSKYINVLGNNIFFVGGGMFGSLWTVDILGNNLRNLLSDRVSDLFVYDGYAYYLNESNGNKICRLDLASGTEDILVDDGIFYLHFADGHLYFQQYVSGSYRLYRTTLEGKNKTLIMDLKENTRAICFADKIYYRAVVKVSGSTKYRLYKMNYDGSGSTMVYSNEPYYINVLGDSVYYVNADQQSNLYVVSKDGIGNKVFSGTMTEVVYVINNELYYRGLVAGQGWRLLKP